MQYYKLHFDGYKRTHYTVSMAVWQYWRELREGGGLCEPNPVAALPVQVYREGGEDDDKGLT